MSMAVVCRPSRHDDQIRFGLGFVIERYGLLDSDAPARREDRPQRIVDGADGRRMIGALGLGDDELTADELDVVPLEYAQLR